MRFFTLALIGTAAAIKLRQEEEVAAEETEHVDVVGMIWDEMTGDDDVVDMDEAEELVKFWPKIQEAFGLSDEAGERAMEVAMEKLDDEQITGEEALEIAAALAGDENMTEDDLNAILTEKMDRNGDGGVCMDEMRAAAEFMGVEMPEDDGEMSEDDGEEEKKKPRRPRGKKGDDSADDAAEDDEVVAAQEDAEEDVEEDAEEEETFLDMMWHKIAGDDLVVDEMEAKDLEQYWPKVAEAFDLDEKAGKRALRAAEKFLEDGEITGEEALKIASAAAGKPMSEEELLEAAKGAMDTNDDGDVCEEEMAAAAEFLGVPVSDEEIAAAAAVI